MTYDEAIQLPNETPVYRIQLDTYERFGEEHHRYTVCKEQVCWSDVWCRLDITGPRCATYFTTQSEAENEIGRILNERRKSYEEWSNMKRTTGMH